MSAYESHYLTDFSPDDKHAMPGIILVMSVHFHFRLNLSSKLSLNSTTLCSAVHFTKALVIVMYHYTGSHDQLTVYRCCTLLVMSLVFIRVIYLDNLVNMMLKEVNN